MDSSNNNLQVLPDLNTSNACYNNPILSQLGNFSTRIYNEDNLFEETIHRVQGVKPARDNMQEGKIHADDVPKYRFIEPDMFVKDDMLHLPNHSSKLNLEVHSQSRMMMIFVPSNYLDGTTFYSLASEDGKTAKPYALYTAKLLQYLHEIFSEDGIKMTWAGRLAGEPKSSELDPEAVEDNDAEGAGKKNKKTDVEDVDKTMFAMNTTFNHRVHGFSNEMYFEVEEEDDRGIRRPFPRCIIEQIQIPEVDNAGVQTNDFFDDENISDNEKIHYAILFNILDPRISINQSVIRHIRHNQKDVQIQQNRARGIKRSKSEMVAHSRVNDVDNYTFDLRFQRRSKELLSVVNDWIHMLAIASTQFPHLKTKAEREIDPMKLLREDSPYDLITMFNIRVYQSQTYSYDDKPRHSIWEPERPAFDMESVRGETVRPGDTLDAGWTNERLYSHNQLDWKKQFYPVFNNSGWVVPESFNFDPMILVYDCPNRVIRESRNHTNGLTWMSAMIPFLVNSTKQLKVLEFENNRRPTKNTRFPQLTNACACSLAEGLCQLAKRLGDGDRIVSMDCDFYVDSIPLQIFGIGKRNRPVDYSTVNLDVPLCTKRVEALLALKRTMTVQQNHPDALRAVFQYINTEVKKDPEYTCFPNLMGKKEDKGFEFEYFERATIVGNVDAIICNRYMDSGCLEVISNHELIRLGNHIMLCSASHLNYSASVTVMKQGPPSAGKTYADKVTATYAIPGTVQNVDTKSAQADNTGVSNACYYIIQEETPLNAPFLDGPDKKLMGEGDAIFKNSITNSESTRQRAVSTTSNTITNVTVITDLRCARSYAMNQSLALMKPAFRSRFLLFLVQITQRYKGLERMQIKKGAMSAPVRRELQKEFTSIIRGFQVFATMVNVSIRVGGLAYDADRDATMRTTIHQRLKNMMEKAAGIALDTSEHTARLEKDKIIPVVQAQMIFRVWCSICVGAIKDDYLRPGAPFNINMIRRLHELRLLQVNEEDYYRALSYFYHDFAYEPMCYILRWLDDILKEDGFTLSTDPNHSPEDWNLKPDATVFYRAKLATDVAPELSGMNLDRIDIERVWWTPKHDMSHPKNDLYSLASTIQARYNAPDVVGIKESLLFLMDATHHANHSYILKYNDAKLAVLPQRTQKSFRAPVLKRLARVENGRTTFTWTVSRHWFESAVNSEYGLLKNRHDADRKGYLNNILKTSMELSRYPGQPSCDILLPGMVYNRVDPEQEDNDDRVYEAPNIMQVLETGDMAKEEYVAVFKQLGMPESQIYLPLVEKVGATTKDNVEGNIVYYPDEEKDPETGLTVFPYECTLDANAFIYKAGFVERLVAEKYQEMVHHGTISTYKLTRDKKELLKIAKQKLTDTANKDGYTRLYSPPGIEQAYQKMLKKDYPHRNLGRYLPYMFRKEKKEMANIKGVNTKNVSANKVDLFGESDEVVEGEMEVDDTHDGPLGEDVNIEQDNEITVKHNNKKQRILVEEEESDEDWEKPKTWHGLLKEVVDSDRQDEDRQMKSSFMDNGGGDYDDNEYMALNPTDKQIRDEEEDEIRLERRENQFAATITTRKLQTVRNQLGQLQEISDEDDDEDEDENEE